jgi:hypothetical protein
MFRRLLLTWLALASAGCWPGLCLQAQNPAPPHFLRSVIPLKDEHVRLLASGQAIALSLPATDKREIAVVGAVHIRVTPDFFVREYLDIANFKKGPEVLQVGKFAEIPDEVDIAGLEIDSGELRDLRNCRPGRCSTKLSAEFLSQFREATGSTASNEDNASAFRRILVRYVGDYLKRGNDALVVYNDRSPQVRLSDEFADLLRGYQTIQQLAPDLAQYLERFPVSPPEGVRDFVYWSKEKAGFKAITSLTHVTLYRKTVENRSWEFITSKQIYATHYFESSMGLSAVIEGSAGDLWLVYVNRSRTDVLRGWFSSLKRSIIRGRAQSALRTQLTETKNRLEDRIGSQSN